MDQFEGTAAEKTAWLMGFEARLTQSLDEMSLTELEEERRRLQHRDSAIAEKIRLLKLAQTFEDHPCSCVRLNSSIGVNSMELSEIKRRQTFGTGFVVQLASADLDCPRCGGTGVPKEESP